jgi:hypothetical protein
MKTFSLLSLFSIFLFFANCQEKTSSKFEKWSLRGDYYKPKGIASFENVTPNQYQTTTNFGFRLGTERNWKENETGRFYQTALLSFYNDVYFERVAGIESAAGIELNIYKGLLIATELAIGYNFARSSHLKNVYEDGRWVQSIDKSVVNHRFQVGLSGYIGYNFSKHFNSKVPLTIYAGYGVNGINHFEKDGGQNLFAYHQPYFGVKWKL